MKTYNMIDYLNNFSKIKAKNISFFIFIILYTTLLIYLGFTINIWEDEAYSLETTSNNLLEVVRQSYNFEGQPPVYFILLAIWRLLSPSIFIARLFSILFIGLAAYFFHRIVQLISGLTNSKWLVVIFLLNPFAVWAALEIRTYSLIIFLSTISMYFFIRYTIDNKKNHLYYFLILCLIGIYTQYIFVFLITALAITLLIFRGLKAFISLCIYLVPVVILFLPNLLFLSDNITNTQSCYPFYPISQRFTASIFSAQNIIFPINRISTHTILIKGIWMTGMLFLVITYIKLYKTHNNINFKKYNGILASTFLLVILYIPYLVLLGIKLNDRYMAIAFPLLILLFIILNWQSSMIRNIIYCTISLYFILTLFYKYSVPIKTYDYESIANYIESIDKPNEPILLNSRTISTPFEYYFQRPKSLVSLPDTFKLEKKGFQVMIKDTIELKQILRSIKSKSILFINDNMLGYSSKLKLTSTMTDKYLNAHYKITLDTLYFGKSKYLSLRIRRLEY